MSNEEKNSVVHESSQSAIRNPQSAINPIPHSSFHIPHSPLRLGVVGYLNMQPLIYGLEATYPRRELELHLGPPSELARWLAAGKIDAGMAPVAAWFAHPQWSVVGRAMIGSRGAVASVLLAGGGPPAKWRTLRPDSHSMTSNALAAILTRRALNLDLAPGAPVPPSDGDVALPAPGEAMVLIGSRALAWRQRLAEAPGVHVIDLGTLWTEWTGLPSVNALWVARAGAALGEWPGRLERHQRFNACRLEEIVQAWPALAHDRLTPEQAHAYLRENIHYWLDAAARRGLERFYAEGRALGLFPAGWQWREYQPLD
jgi:chorismate dehydratase